MQKASSPSDAERPDDGRTLAGIVQRLEPEHAGKYVMIDPLSGDYVVAPRVSEVHLKFTETFGSKRAGHCLRIGASPFAIA